MADHDIRQLLTDAAPHPRRPDFERLWRRARRQRRLGQAAMAVAIVALIVPAAAAAAVLFDRQVTGPAVADSPPPSCPVTIPTGGFVPPDPYPPQPAVWGDAWYGSEALWTALPADGVLDGRRKSVWWSVDYPGGIREPQPDIQVTWHRLDWPDSATITAGGPGTNGTDDRDSWFMIGGIDPPIGGCWQVTATYRDATLSYVYRYHDPFTERLVPANETQLFTPQLREVADLQPHDQLYALPLTGTSDGRQLYVRMRDNTRPLLFGTACSLVNSVPLPRGWEGLCLEYNAQGRRITGVFPYGTADNPSTTTPQDNSS